MTLSAPFENMHILVVDDDTHIRKLLSKYLRRYDYLVTATSDAQCARHLLKALSFDIIILDVMMPGETGLDLARFIRQTLQTPVILLTALGETHHRIEGLQAGADDYLVKPFEPQELLLRINAILKRALQNVESPEGEMLYIGDMICDLENAKIIRDGEEVSLTMLESGLMKTLTTHLNTPVSRQQLLKSLNRPHDEDDPAQERIVDVQITRLRRKLEPDPTKRVYLKTVRGEGYMLTDGVE